MYNRKVVEQIKVGDKNILNFFADLTLCEGLYED